LPVGCVEPGDEPGAESALIELERRVGVVDRDNKPARRRAGASANITGEVSMVAVPGPRRDLGESSAVVRQRGEGALESQNACDGMGWQTDLVPEV
jgi:hypothetical protein